eukprot:4917983-Pleurochrysis_carterae.AAC.3
MVFVVPLGVSWLVLVLSSVHAYASDAPTHASVLAYACARVDEHAPACACECCECLSGPDPTQPTACPFARPRGCVLFRASVLDCLRSRCARCEFVRPCVQVVAAAAAPVELKETAREAAARAAQRATAEAESMPEAIDLQSLLAAEEALTSAATAIQSVAAEAQSVQGVRLATPPAEMKTDMVVGSVEEKMKDLEEALNAAQTKAVEAVDEKVEEAVHKVEVAEEMIEKKVEEAVKKVKEVMETTTEAEHKVEDTVEDKVEEVVEKAEEVVEQVAEKVEEA